MKVEPVGTMVVVAVMATASAHAEERSPKALLAHAWTVKVMRINGERAKAAEGQTWTFGRDGSFTRTRTKGEAERGEWTLTKVKGGRYVVTIAVGEQRERLAVIQLGPRTMKLQTARKGKEPVRVEDSRFAAFFHS